MYRYEIVFIDSDSDSYRNCYFYSKKADFKQKDLIYIPQVNQDLLTNLTEDNNNHLFQIDTIFWIDCVEEYVEDINHIYTLGYLFVKYTYKNNFQHLLE
jgi:hypothetical protein